MKIRKKEDAEYEADILEEDKTEIRTSSSQTDELNRRSDYNSDSESSTSSSSHGTEASKVTSSSSHPSTAIHRPCGSRAFSTTAPLKEPDDEEEKKTAARKTGVRRRLYQEEQPDAPTRPVRGRPPSTRPFHNFLAALRPLMRNASAAAVVEWGADLWAAMDDRQRRPFCRAARRARQMRMHRRSGRSMSSVGQGGLRNRRRSRHIRTVGRSMLQQTISYVPRVLTIPTSSTYAQNVRRRGNAVHTTTLYLRGGGRSPRRRRSCPSPLHPRPPRNRLRERSITINSPNYSRLRRRCRSGVTRNRTVPRPTTKMRCRSARSRRPRRQCDVHASNSMGCATPVSRRGVGRRPRSRSRSGAGRRSRSRVRRPRPRGKRRRPTTASTAHEETSGKENEQDDAGDEADKRSSGEADRPISRKTSCEVAKDEGVQQIKVR